MPFLGKDWRSSGEQWIKTEHGWERIKVLECILDHINSQLIKEASQPTLKRNSSFDTITDDETDIEGDLTDLSLASEDTNEDRGVSLSVHSSTSSLMQMVPRKPFVYINRALSETAPAAVHSYRENRAPKPTISEVLNGLDMVGAVKDIRRFNYVAKLLQLIINEKLTQLSGNAQRTLFLIVRVMLEQVIESKQNMNVMRKLLMDYKVKLQSSYHYHFHYIGSQQLGERHLMRISKWLQRLEKEITKTSLRPHHLNCQNVENMSGELNMMNIPNDCKLEILRRLNTGLDLVNLSKCNKSFNSIISREISIWQNLCFYHFQQSNINQVLAKKANDQNTPKVAHQNDDGETELDWKLIYFRLKRRYGHKEVYVDMVHKCMHCKCLFWKEIGHPCIIASEEDMASEPITPKKLITILLM